MATATRNLLVLLMLRSASPSTITVEAGGTITMEASGSSGELHETVATQGQAIAELQAEIQALKRAVFQPPLSPPASPPSPPLMDPWECQTPINSGKSCGSPCLNDNTAYSSIAEAWAACGTVSGCDLVMTATGGSSSYLRRNSDPDCCEGSYVMRAYSSAPCTSG